ncbi:dTDP-4-dehydrorhamnose reductase [Pilibacter termitis]|uniref:dTDP-4-dehydrorhamnose reductase n=1 Tax=Pilibacter termitis TaxID=263852 RepID=A0A1T4P930_9ENTE|nr:dTDP-4-dehydrorhamnose reductase [Pilibacter termitis]SJZ87827.1 dTDP-4-dehydrorhamnose reductase [Pilibacter termitis]
MILITGANGQLGTEIRHLLDERKIEYVGTDVAEMDITSIESVEKKFEEVTPEIVFHVAAYTAVDKAEDEGKELDYQINVVGTQNIAKTAEKYGAKLIYISTDYVFDGTKIGEEYFPEDTCNPQSEYGRTKRLGEEAVLAFSSKSYIVRTSWVFGNFGHNFVFTMQKLAETHPVLTVVNDQTGRPTWTRTLAEFLVHLIENEEKAPFGIYHLSNDNIATWYDFAKEILKDKEVEVKPVTSAEFPQKAKRPEYSVMSLAKAKATGFVIPTWQEALEKMLEQGKK